MTNLLKSVITVISLAELITTIEGSSDLLDEPNQNVIFVQGATTTTKYNEIIDSLKNANSNVEIATIEKDFKIITRHAHHSNAGLKCTF